MRMQLFITTAAALAFLGMATATHAAEREHNLPFLHGLNDNPGAGKNHLLAQKIRDSLKKDPSGNAKIDEARCNQDGSCASARNWLESYQHDDASLTLDKLADYIDSLVAVTPTAKEYDLEWDMDCLHASGNGLYQTVIGCMHRKYKPGEVIYVDPKTRKPKLAGDCANPIRGEHKDAEELAVTGPKIPCYELDYTVPANTIAVRYEYVSDHKLGSNPGCPNRVILPGEARPSEFSDKCPDENCSFREPEAYVLRYIAAGKITNVKNLDVRSVSGSHKIAPVNHPSKLSFIGGPDMEYQVVIVCITVQNTTGVVTDPKHETKYIRYSNGRAATGGYGPEHRLDAGTFSFPSEKQVQ